MFFGCWPDPEIKKQWPPSPTSRDTEKVPELMAGCQLKYTWREDGGLVEESQDYASEHLGPGLRSLVDCFCDLGHGSFFLGALVYPSV